MMPLTVIANHHSHIPTMVFLFGSTQGYSVVLKSSIGPCQFCHSGKVDLIKKHRRFWLWCCIPMAPTSHEMITCRNCRKCIKSEYYYSSNLPINDEKNVKTVEEETKLVIEATPV